MKENGLIMGKQRFLRDRVTRIPFLFCNNGQFSTKLAEESATEESDLNTW